MTTTDVATREPGGAVVPANADIPGLSGEFGRGDISIPICSISQNMSQDKGEAGMFAFPDGSSFEELEVVVLDVVATRALWTPIDDETVEGPLCRSTDRVLGMTDYPLRVVGDKAEELGVVDSEETTVLTCETCPHFKDAVTFTKPTSDGPAPLMCRNGYTLLMYEDNMEEVILFFVKGSAVSPVKKKIVSPALRRYRKNGQAMPWANAFTWKVTHKIEGKKNWYQPDIMPGEPFDNEKLDFYEDMARSLSGRAQQSDEPVEDDDLSNLRQQAGKAYEDYVKDHTAEAAFELVEQIAPDVGAIVNGNLQLGKLNESQCKALIDAAYTPAE